MLFILDNNVHKVYHYSLNKRKKTYSKSRLHQLGSVLVKTYLRSIPGLAYLLVQQAHNDIKIAKILQKSQNVKLHSTKC